MGSPKPPPPDPAIAAAQAAEQRRAEAGQVAQTQAGLNSDGIAIRRRFGSMAKAVGPAAPGSGSGSGFTYLPGRGPFRLFSSLGPGTSGVLGL